MVYRIPNTWSGPKLPWKVLHGILALGAFILTVLGLVAVFYFHNSQGTPNMYSLHSWMGLGTVLLFSCQVRTPPGSPNPSSILSFQPSPSLPTVGSRFWSVPASLGSLLAPGTLQAHPCVFWLHHPHVVRGFLCVGDQREAFLQPVRVGVGGREAWEDPSQGEGGLRM